MKIKIDDSIVIYMVTFVLSVVYKEKDSLIEKTKSDLYQTKIDDAKDSEEAYDKALLKAQSKFFKVTVLATAIMELTPKMFIKKPNNLKIVS